MQQGIWCEQMWGWRRPGRGTRDTRTIPNLTKLLRVFLTHWEDGSATGHATSQVNSSCMELTHHQKGKFRFIKWSNGGKPVETVHRRVDKTTAYGLLVLFWNKSHSVD